MNELMADMNHVIDWDSYEHDDTSRLNHSKLPTKSFDSAHHTKYDGWNTEDSDEGDMDVLCGKDEDYQSHDDGEANALESVFDKRSS